MALLASSNPANDTGLDCVYYDGQNTCYQVADYSADLATWYPKAQDAAKPYRDYWVIGQNAGQGYRYFAHGLVEDILRNGTVKATTAMNVLLTTGYAITNGTTGNPYGEYYLQGEQGTRETAYALMTHLEARRPNTGLTANTARIGVLYGYAKAHLDLWITGGGSTFLRPFMAALTSKALIQYYEQYSADAIIVTKIAALFEQIWTLMWGVVDGFGALSFQYTNVDTTTLNVNYTNAGGTIANPAYNSGGMEESVNLNLLIAPVFGWLYSVTRDSKWKTRGDLIFDEGISVYNGSYTTQIRGTYFGTGAAPQGKIINQNFFWSDKYLTYTAAAAIVTPVTLLKEIFTSITKLVPFFTVEQCNMLINVFGEYRRGTLTWDPANIVDGAMTSTTLTVTGAKVGDLAEAVFSVAIPAGVLITVSIIANDIAAVTLLNKTGGPLDLSLGTLTVLAKRLTNH